LEKVIITGGTGFIGRHLVKRLPNYAPSSVALVSNTHNISGKYLVDINPQEKMPLKYYTADIRDKQAISSIFRDEKADTCIHLAAKISVADSIHNPHETMEINVKGTLNVLEACYNSNVKNFVFASSAAVYGDVKALPISENHTLGPLSPYGKSKMLAEEYVSSYSKLKRIQNTAILRIFNAYGNGQTSEADVITKFASRLSRGLPPVIYGGGKYTRDFIAVDDVVDGILLSIKAMEKNYAGKLNSPPIFNFGSGIPTSIDELAHKMISISGLELNPIYEVGDHEDGVILHSYADITKAKRSLHFVAKKNLETGLRELMELMHVSRNASKDCVKN
jgi:UDP-glucose 4-epimerase